jgi:signal transduction histidine kinase/PAS domain-containing protein
MASHGLDPQIQALLVRVSELDQEREYLLARYKGCQSEIVQLINNHARLRESEAHYMDHCREPQLYDDAEIEILRIAAAGLAAVIERQVKDDELRLVQQAQLQAEQKRSKELKHLNNELQRALDHISESEKYYRSLFEISNEGIYRWELEQPVSIHLPIEQQIEQIYQNYYCAQANDAYSQMMGFTQEEDSIGLRLSALHISESAKNHDFMQGFIRNGYSSCNAESEEIGITGRKCYFLNSAIGFIEHDHLTGGWGSQLDITELRETQQALLQAEQDRTARLAKTNQALKSSIDCLAANPDLNSFLGYMLREIAQQLHLDYVNLNFYDAATETLPLELQIRNGQVRLKHEMEAPEAILCPSIHSTPIWDILRETKQPLVINRDNAKDPCFQDACDRQADDLRLQVVVNLLLSLGDEPIGLLGLGSTQRTSFTPQELELTQVLTHQITLAIQLTRLAEEVKHASLLQERNRIAQDIHDTLAQTFGGILIQLQATQYFVKRNPDLAVEQFKIAIDLARQGLAEARRSVWTLYNRGTDYQALETALPALAECLTRDSTTKATVTVSGNPYHLDPDIGQNLLRLTQEALNNALRHAHATLIQIKLDYTPDLLSLQIQDDGCGFEMSQPIQGFGIISMKQRADCLGSILNINSQVGVGTELAIAIVMSPQDTQTPDLTDYLPLEGASKPEQI